MCGVIGFVSDKPAEQNYKMLGDLLYLASSRGTDATGVAVAEGKKVKVVKEDISADKFIKKHYVGLKKDIAKSKVVLGHTRLATQGHQRDNDNNHPIISDNYVMVHNGTCSSMDRVKDYKYRGQVDSEILLSHIETKGLKEGLKSLRGSAAIALVSPDKPGEVYLWRHNNPLWVAYNPEKKTLFFGSTKDILEEGLADILEFFSSFHMRELPEDCLYKITCDPLKIEFVEEIEPTTGIACWQKKSSNSHSYGYGAGYGYQYGDDYYDYYDHRITKKDPEPTPLNSDTPPEVKDPKRGTYVGVYQEVLNCKWDARAKVFTTEPITSVGSTSTRYYFEGPSFDFDSWRRLEGGGHVSIDKKLVKFFDREKKAHYIMLVTEAIKEGLIDLSK